MSIRGPYRYVEQKISPMQRLISENLRILMINQEDSGTRREILKQALYFARLLLSLQCHSSPSEL